MQRLVKFFIPVAQATTVSDDTIGGIAIASFLFIFVAVVAYVKYKRVEISRVQNLNNTQSSTITHSIQQSIDFAATDETQITEIPMKTVVVNVQPSPDNAASEYLFTFTDQQTNETYENG